MCGREEMSLRRLASCAVWISFAQAVASGCDANDACDQDFEDPTSLLLLQTQTQLTMGMQTVTTLRPATAADAEPPYYFAPLKQYAAEAAATAATQAAVKNGVSTAGPVDGVASPDPPVPGYVPVNGSALAPEPALNGSGLDKWDEDYITDSNYGPNFTVRAIDTPGVQPAEAARDLAGILFGVTAFLVFLAYVLNLTSALTQASMWCVTDKMVAAFIAALVMAGYRDTVDYFTSTQFYADYYLAGAFIRLVTVLLLLQLLFVSLHSSPQEDGNLRAVETLGSYALGFAAVDAFGGMQKLDGTDIAGINFSNSPGSALCGAGCAALLLGIGLHVLSAVRKTTSRDSNKTGWLDENEESEDEASAICIGFLLSQVALFCLTSSLPPVIGMPVLQDTSQVPSEAFVTITCFLACWLVFASCIWSFTKLRSLQEFHKYHRVEIMAVRLISMFLAWCCIRLGQIVFRSSSLAWLGSDDAVMQHLLFALVTSVSILLFVVLGTSLVPGSIEKGTPDYYILSSAAGLIAAYPWAQLFYLASESFGVSINAPEGHDRSLVLTQMRHPPRPNSGEDSLWQVVLLLSFAVLLAVPWKVYILPRSARTKTSILATGLRAVENAAERTLSRVS